MPIVDSETIEFVVQEMDQHKRLDQVLSGHPLVSSRSQAIKLIKSGLVEVKTNKSALFKKAVKAALIVEAGTTVKCQLVKNESDPLVESCSESLQIRYEDADIIVVNKPSGVVVHPGAGNFKNTLIHQLIHRYPDLKLHFDDERPGVVHRLDKDTSGLLVIARNPLAKQRLIQQFKERSIYRLYQAVALGHFQFRQGHIESILSRHPKHRKKYISKPLQNQKDTSGKYASTRYWVKDGNHDQLSFVELRLETGRTHQIRVHMQSLGHPLIGDSIYGFKRNRFSQAEELWLQLAGSRVGLHAKRLGFIHPRTEKPFDFCESWPENTRGFFEKYGWTKLADC